MSKIRRPTMSTPMPKAYVQSVLSKIGVPCGAVGTTATSTPYWSHAMMEWILTKLDMPSTYIRFSHGTQTRGFGYQIRFTSLMKPLLFGS